ncbi:MAG: winged helix-turn-helix transcriptional regulator [Victivallales bacterium]|nr:winged helix-turn-helix transcriptional regulator [Victivallales bacterium]
MEETQECFVVHKKNVEKALNGLADDLTLSRMAEIFQCFADPTRLKIINALLLSELCVCDLTRIMNMTQPAVSHHLKHLREIRLVKATRTGKSVFYSLDDYHVPLLFDICRSHLSETHGEEKHEP